MRCKVQNLIIVLVALLLVLGILHLFETNNEEETNDLIIEDPVKERELLQHLTRDPKRKVVYNYPTSNEFVMQNIQIDVSKGLIKDWAELDRHMVVVTGFKQSEAILGLGMIASVHSHMPMKRIIVYALGISPSIHKKLNAMCNVVVRRFDLKQYSKLVQKTESQAWRYYVAKEVLKEYGAFFYASPQVRFRAPVNLLLPFMEKYNGLISRVINVSLYDTTHPETFNALKINIPEFKSKFPTVRAITPSVLVVMNNSQLEDSVWRPLSACIEDWDCLAPKGSTWKYLDKNATNSEHTHYYFSSAINIFMYKYFGTEWAEDKQLDKVIDRVVALAEAGKAHDHLWAHYCNPPKAEVDCSLYRSKC